LIRQSNAGASAARNRAFGHSSGDFIQYLDADDVLEPSKIAAQLAHLEAYPPRTIASCPWARFERDYEKAKFRPEPVWCDASPEDFLLNSWAGGGMMPPLVWLTPRQVIENAGSWNESLSVNDDGEFFTRALLKSSGIAFCSDAKGYYRRTIELSLSKRRDLQAIVSGFHAIELSCANLLKMNASESARHACACLYQQFVYDYYPNNRDLMGKAESRVRELGGTNLKCHGGQIFQIASVCMGWKIARHIQLSTRRILTSQ
jgi:glycosyltransferase involved in cell wall biosynthesis